MKGSWGNQSVRVWRRTFQVMQKRGSCFPFCDVVVLPSIAYKKAFPRRFPFFFSFLVAIPILLNAFALLFYG
jgi:hypothetical protein